MSDFRAAVLVTLTVLAGPVGADASRLDSETDRINYSLGYQVGGDFKREAVNLDAETLVKGIDDALSGAEPLMPREEMNATLMELKRKLVAEQRAERRAAELDRLAQDKKFMEENAAKPGVTTTASGLQYKIVEAGTGRTPKPTDEVTVNYRGSLINGNEFDSSYRRGEPSRFRLDGVIRGWTEGLQLIGEGGRIQLVIPPELAYGARGPLAHRTLLFDVELLSVGDGKKAESSRKEAAGGRK